jgi:hypothetical protein
MNPTSTLQSPCERCESGKEKECTRYKKCKRWTDWVSVSWKTVCKAVRGKEAVNG